MRKSITRRMARGALLVGVVCFFIWAFGVPGVPARPEHLGIGSVAVFTSGDESWMLLDVRRYRYRSGGALVSVKAVSSTESVWFVHFTGDGVGHIGKLPGNVKGRKWLETFGQLLDHEFFIHNGSTWRWTGKQFEIVEGLSEDAPWSRPNKAAWGPYGDPMPFSMGDVTLALERRGPKAQELWLVHRAPRSEWQQHLFSLQLDGVASKDERMTTHEK